MNLVGGIGILMLAYNPVATKGFVMWIISAIKKMGLLKKYDSDKALGPIEDYAKHIEEIRQNKKAMLILVVYTVLQLIAFFSITYFVYLALGQTGGASYVDILAIQTVVYVVVSFIPTPGGAGASEGSFYLLFKAFFAGDVLLYGMALWRIIIYYGSILVSGIVIGFDKVFRMVAKKTCRGLAMDKTLRCGLIFEKK